MKRQSLFCSTMISLFSFSLGCSSNVYKGDSNGLSVTICPKTTLLEAEIDTYFEIELRVANATRKPLSFRAMSCSWGDHWVVRINEGPITRAGWGSANCFKNNVVTITLKPGEAYEKTALMSLNDHISLKSNDSLSQISLQAGFTPIDEKKTYWSNRVVLRIKPGKHN